MSTKVSSLSVLKALGIDKPSEYLCRMARLVLSILAEGHNRGSVSRSYARDFVNFIHQHVEPNNENGIKWKNLAKALKERNKNKQSVCDVKNMQE